MTNHKECLRFPVNGLRKEKMKVVSVKGEFDASMFVAKVHGD